MSRRGWILAISLAPAGWAAGQAPGPVPETTVDVAAEDGDLEAWAVPHTEEACFRSSEIRDFDTLSDRFVLLETIKRETFILTMFEGCVGLRSTMEIALVSDLNRVCSNSNASVRYRGALGQSTCPIVTVESVDDKEAGKWVAAMRERE